MQSRVGSPVSTEPIVVVVDRDLEDLIPLFLTQRKNDLGKLSQALGEGDFESMRRVGHAMNGAGASYGFPYVSELGLQIESAARDGDLDRLGALSRALKDYLARLVVKYL